MARRNAFDPTTQALVQMQRRGTSGLGRSAGDVGGRGASSQASRSPYVDQTKQLAAQGFVRPPEYSSLNRRRYNEDALRGGYYQGGQAGHAYGWNQADPWSVAQISHEQTRGRGQEAPWEMAQAPVATQTPVGEYRPDTAFDLQEDRLPDPSWNWLIPPPGGRR